MFHNVLLLVHDVYMCFTSVSKVFYCVSSCLSVFHDVLLLVHDVYVFHNVLQCLWCFMSFYYV